MAFVIYELLSGVIVEENLFYVVTFEIMGRLFDHNDIYVI